MNNIIVNDVSKITDIKFEPIEYDNYFVKKFCPINKNSDIPLHKFWLVAEKCKVLNVTGNKFINNGEISVVFSNRSKYLNNKLELENKIRNILKKKLHSEFDIATTCKFLYDSSTVFFNSNDVEEKYNISIGSEFDLIVELKYIDLCSKHINFIWKIVQMKKITMIDLKVSLFAKHNSYITQEYNRTTHIDQKPLFTPSLNDLNITKKQMENVSIHNQTTNQIPKQIAISNTIQQNTRNGIAFTPALLQGALSKLKKLKTDNDEEPIHIPIENGQIIKQIEILKHVETKETNIIEIFRNEYKEKIKNDYALIVKINSNIDIIFENLNNNILTGLQILKKMDRYTEYGRISNYS